MYVISTPHRARTGLNLPAPLRPTLFLLTLLPLIGCSFSKEWRYLPTSVDDEKQVYVVSHGWHTGIVIAGEDLGPELTFLNDYFTDSRYFELGWGDEAFYQAEEITFSMTLKAALWPSDSVMHVVALPEAPDRYFPHSQSTRLTLSSEGLSQLQESLAASFYRTDQGMVLSGASGLYGNSRFFQGVGRFHLFNTCNSWTARTLEAGGVPTSRFLTLTADSVMQQTEAALKQYQCCLP